MKTKFTYLFLVIPFISFAQIGLGLGNKTEITADFDVNYPLNLPDLEIVQDNSVYKKYVVSDTNGNLALRTIPAKTYHYKSNAFQEMTAPVNLTNDKRYTSLNLPITVTIPANKINKIQLNYTIPVVWTGIGNETIPKTTAQLYITKQVGNGLTSNILASHRIFYFSKTYMNKTAPKGGTVTCEYVETIDNTSNTDIVITYNMVTQGSNTYGAYNVQVGMFNPSANQNWGKGIFYLRVFEQ